VFFSFDLNRLNYVKDLVIQSYECYSSCLQTVKQVSTWSFYDAKSKPQGNGESRDNTRINLS